MVEKNEVLKDQELEIIDALRKLKNVKEIFIDLFGDSVWGTTHGSEIRKVISEVHKRQATRGDLMF